MNLNSLSAAIHLAVNLDRELLTIVVFSLKVSGISTILAGLFGIPVGMLIAFETFRGKRLLIAVLNTLLSFPTVIVGLFVYSLVSRRGLLGEWDLLYTQYAIIIGQTIIIVPLVTTYVIAVVSRLDSRYRKTAMTLGANRWQTAQVIFLEARYGIAAAIIAAFGRVISEVGISMMIGGNIKGFTRTITTAMALEYDKGEFILALALGFILLSISFTINIIFHFFQGKSSE